MFEAVCLLTLMMPVQARIHGLVVLIEIQKLGKEFIVDGAVGRVWLEYAVDRNVFMNIVEGHQAQADQCNVNRAAAVGADGVLHLAHGTIQYIRHDLTPDVSLRTAADHVHRFEAVTGKSFHALQ